jgi:hypothetical protein
MGLSKDHLYSSKRQSDCIAIVAIYIPIIRDEVVAYVEIWNNHSIRAQKNRPHHVSGKPKVNYLFSKMKKVADCGRPIDPELVDALRADTAEWGKNASKILMYALLIICILDIDEYLPLATLQWCSDALATVNIDLSKLYGHQLVPGSGKERLHKAAYLWLREHLRCHIEAGTEPNLQETSPPVGGYEYYEKRGGAVGQLIHENAQTVVERSGEIRVVVVLVGSEQIVDEDWDQERLEVNT